MRRSFILLFSLFFSFIGAMAQYGIIPMPQKISFDKKGRWLKINPTTAIVDKLNADIVNPEGWRITVDKKGITIEGSTEAGIFYGHQALRQVMTSKPDTLPYAVIESTPRFAYRGMHLDVCRHFFPKEVVKRFIDMLAAPHRRPGLAHRNQEMAEAHRGGCLATAHHDRPQYGSLRLHTAWRFLHAGRHP